MAARIFVNGRIYTLDGLGTTAEALSVEDERVTAIGDIASVREAVGARAEEIDLAGRTVIPGCIDTHCHAMMHGLACTRSADLTDCRSITDLQQSLRDHRAKNPDQAWLVGERFDHELFSERRWVTKDDLDQVSKDIPIMTVRLCYHAVVANTAALVAVRDKLSDEQWATGKLTEDDVNLVWDQIPECTEQELETAALYALNAARRVGLTSIHCLIGDDNELDTLRRLHSQGRLPIRLRIQWPYERMGRLIDEGLRTGSGDDYLRYGSIKIFMDGSMGARTCAMCEEFSDDPGNLGDLFRTDRELAEMLVKVQQNRCQAAIHAIGDRAIIHGIGGIELAMNEGNPANMLRHRIEHVAQTSPRILDDMVRLNVMASVQPQFVITDFWTKDRVGPERYKYTYPFKSMLNAGIKFGMGSDCPVERLDTMELLHRAVNRDAESKSECLTVDQTLRAYTSGSAYIGFDEKHKGSLEIGKLADFIVLSENPYSVEPRDLGGIRPVHTVVGGNMQ